jgi:cell division protein FtsQ
LANLTTCSAVAKIDSQASRAAMFADDDRSEEFFRPESAPAPRAKAAQDVSSERRRKPAQPAAGGASSTEDDGFLRARRRVPVRRGLIPATRAGRIVAGSLGVLGLVTLVLFVIGVRNFFRDDPRFRISSPSDVQIVGNTQVTRPELLSVFAPDLGHNIFSIPLSQRQAALEQLPWVEHATLMRLLPDQLRVSVMERVPVAFVRQGNAVNLIDANGVLLRLSPSTRSSTHYSFPVVTGISAKDPLSQRAARMHLYQQFVSDLDSGGPKISSQLSEVDVSDPNDVWALLPAEGNDIQVHFGNSDFLTRYRSYQQLLPEWRQQYPHLASVDMRYEGRAILKMSKQSGEQAQEGQTVSGPGHHAAPAKRPAARPAAKSSRNFKTEG